MQGIVKVDVKKILGGWGETGGSYFWLLFFSTTAPFSQIMRVLFSFG